MDGACRRSTGASRASQLRATGASRASQLRATGASRASQLRATGASRASLLRLSAVAEAVEADADVALALALALAITAWIAAGLLYYTSDIGGSAWSPLYAGFYLINIGFGVGYATDRGDAALMRTPTKLFTVFYSLTGTAIVAGLLTMLIEHAARRAQSAAWFGSSEFGDVVEQHQQLNETKVNQVARVDRSL